MYTVNGNKHDSITTEFCQDWVAETQDGTNFLEKGGMDSIDKALEAGVVLVMSLWDDHEANMLWLDSTYPVDSTSPGYARGTCPTFSGVPKDVESAQADSKVTFSDTSYGPIGSALDSPLPMAPFGLSSNFKIDTTKPFQVTTQFITEGNTDFGKLKEVKQFYYQNDQTIEHSMYTVNGNRRDSVTTDFCKDWFAMIKDGTNFLEKGGMDSTDKTLEAGVASVMPLWKILGSARGTCPTTSGIPKDVDSAQTDSKVTFSDISYENATRLVCDLPGCTGLPWGSSDSLHGDPSSLPFHCMPSTPMTT